MSPTLHREGGYRNYEPVAGSGQVAATPVALLPVEAVGRAGYRELRKRGVSRDPAWNTSNSVHGPWRISHSTALYPALPELAAR